LSLTTNPGRRLSALAASVRQQAPTIAVMAVAAAAVATIRGKTTLGPYHVLVTSYGLRPLAHWTLANVADVELYLGVIPLAAFVMLLVQAFRSNALSPEVRRLVLLTASLGAGLLATVAALSASTYGLGRVHERNLFYVVPLVVISFFAWVEAGLPRPRRTAAAVAVVLALLPLTIPTRAVGSSGEDGIALLLWADMNTRPAVAIGGMALAAAIAAALFLRSTRPAVLLGVCLAALVAGTVAGEFHAVDAVRFNRSEWRDYQWIDRAVGPDSRVVALWATTKTAPQAMRIGGLWADEFFNRSVRDVASADGPLPDGLPVTKLKIRSDGCLEAAFARTPEYAVVESSRPLAAPVVQVSPSRRAVLYRLVPRVSGDGCFARLQR
jgi:hypothetical protein